MDVNMIVKSLKPEIGNRKEERGTSKYSSIPTMCDEVLITPRGANPKPGPPNSDALVRQKAF